MKSLFIHSIFPVSVCILLTFVLIKVVLKYAIKLKLVDIPNNRKVHKKPIPAAGGLVMGVSIAMTTLLFPSFQSIIAQHYPFFISLLLLMIVGVIDDRLDISAKLRFLIEITCAYWVANSGMRLTSLHGILGITDMPLSIQYVVTIFIIVGVTNAFNLIDGIDGLAGSFAVLNLIILAVMCVLCKENYWLGLLMAIVGSLMIFLKFNWRPAKIFMGDGGSLMFGFLTATLGIHFIENSYAVNANNAPMFVALLAAAFMIPVIDTLRVFYVRLKKGRSPFRADRNHLHHWLIKQHLLHNQATKRVIGFHIFLLIFSLAGIQFMSLSTIVFLIAFMVISYTKLLQWSSYFLRWFKFVKRMEAAG